MNSADPVVPPLIFTNEDNLETMLSGFMIIHQVFQTSGFRKFRDMSDANPVLGCEDTSYNYSDYWKPARQRFMLLPPVYLIEWVFLAIKTASSIICYACMEIWNMGQHLVALYQLQVHPMMQLV